MRFFKVFSLLVVTAALMYLVCFAADKSVYRDVIRFHVIANSDSEEDQRIKMEVRDLILEKYGEVFSHYNTKDDALCAIENSLSDIESDVEAYLLDIAEYSCNVSISESYFPTRTYGSYSLPRGNYTALTVKLGDSEGQNFWCVLFPPLCLGASMDNSGEEAFISRGLTRGEYELMKKEKVVYKLKFRFLEWFG